MKMRLFGERTGLQVSSLALGTGRLGLGKDGTVDEEEAERTIAAYLDAGGNFIDTSSRYLGGRAEELVGGYIQGAHRDDIVVASKFGRTSRATPSATAAGQHRKALQAEVEGSLRRLGTDHIDLLFAHTDDGVTPIEELMYGMENLVRAGKVIYVGLSSFPAWRAASAASVAELRGWAPLAALTLHYNLLERASEHENLPLARARGLAVLAWSPLAGGLLAGRKPLRYKGEGEELLENPVALEVGPQSPEGMVTKDEQAQAIVDAVVEIAGEISEEPAAVAVAWALSRGVFPVLGPRHAEQLAGNLRGGEIALGEDQLDRLDRVSMRPAGFPYEMLDFDRLELGLDVVDSRIGAVL